MKKRKKKLRAVIDRDGTMCWLCQHPTSARNRSLDHVVPVSKGGRHGIDNLKLAHKGCNCRRGNADAPMSTDERIALQKRGEPA